MDNQPAFPVPSGPSSGISSGPSSGISSPPSWIHGLTERQTVWLLMLFGVLLYLPFAGSYGLWDPWETHYGEVARQMTARGDYISLWWPGSPLDGAGFWSKPVLTFWIMSLALKVAGLGKAGAFPGEMALGSAAEWALRVPFCLTALAGLYGVYLVASRFVSRRAGLLSAVVLATMPLYSLVARQAMTDMPFVGPMTLALALGALALFDDDGPEPPELPRRSLSRWGAWGRRLSWPHHAAFYTAMALFAITVVPQLVINSIQLRWTIPKSSVSVIGLVPMLPYIAGALAFVWLAARTRYRAPLYLYTAAILCGLAVLAKGLAGLGLPVIILLAYLLFTWNWARLRRPQMGYGIAVALLACLVVAVPWHHAMLIRHGMPFWNELYGDNHWRRLMLGRHGDRGSFEYFLREGAYGILPWLSVAPCALTWAAMRRKATDGLGGVPRERAHAQDIYWFGAIWFVAAYAVVSLSMTKFHHYILPALPGLAITVGCFLDDLLSRGRTRLAALVALAGLPMLAVVTFDLTSETSSVQRFLWLFSYDYINAPKGRPWPPELAYVSTVLAFVAVFALATAALSWRRLQRWAVVGLGVGAVAFSFFLLDVYMRQTSHIWSQKNLIATYYKERRSPDERLVAWQMYWRGENFYTSNEIYEGPAEKTVFLGDRNAENLKEYLQRSKGKRVFFVVEKARWSTLRGLVPDYARASLHAVDERNNKFSLAVVQL